MKKQHYIVDGYNVINAWPELSALKDPLDDARERLIAILQEYGAYLRYEITIVFDAFFTPSRASLERVGADLQVVFTGEGETADSYIEKLAYELAGQGREVYVVTSDWAEQTVILGAGAYRVSAREFLRAVKKTKKKMAEKYIAQPALTARRELGGRISENIAKRLEELRKRR